jgi:hypothetical protein
LRQIRRIIEAFDWTKYKPPVCAYADHDGTTVLKVLDGQHTAIAAAGHPNIDMIPVMIVEAADIASQAAAFVGQNTNHLGVTLLQQHKAAIIAGDDDALTVEQVCGPARVVVLTSPPSRAEYQPRETVAINALRQLIDKRGAMKARMVLEALANADLAPITANHIRAADLLMTDPEYAGGFEPADLTRAIETSGKTADHEAKIFSVAHKVPVWKALAITWFKKTRKRH